MLHIKTTSDEAATLAYNSTSQLKMELLAGAQFKMSGISLEVFSELRDGLFVRIQIVDTQSAAYVDVGDRGETSCFKVVLQFVDSHGKGNKIFHVEVRLL